MSDSTIGYKPTKLGRSIHTLHTSWLSNMRLVLDVEVQSGRMLPNIACPACDS